MIFLCCILINIKLFAIYKGKTEKYMDFEKVEKSFDTMFKSLNGEIFMIGNSIKVKYLGLNDTLINAGGSYILTPNFEFISTNKSFTYEYIVSQTLKKLGKVSKYLGLNEKTFNVTVSYDLPEFYITEEDNKHINTFLKGIKTLTLESNIEQFIEVTPIDWSYRHDSEYNEIMLIEFQFFIKGGSITIRTGEKLNLPSTPDNDYYIQSTFDGSEIKELKDCVDSLSSRTLMTPGVDFRYRVIPIF